MKKKAVFLFTTLFLTLFIFSTSGVVSASTLLFDRGLPTANLNTAAGSNRSNVLWADWETTDSPSEYWLPGDDIILSGSGMYHIDTVRLWTTTVDTGAFALLAGSDLSNAGTFSTYTVTPVTYVGGENYQTSLGNFIDIFQLDFEINEDVMAGTEYYFFLDGPWTDYGNSGYVNPYLHASNATLSGSNQEGADDYFQWLHINANGIVGVESWLSTGGGTTGWGAGWDKNSDANIQIYGNAVPEPATMLLFGLGLLGFAGVSRKKLVK